MTYTDAEREQIERDNDERIDHLRKAMGAVLRDLDAGVRNLRSTFRMLASNEVYDVECAEGASSHLAPALFTQIECALAGLSTVLPDPESAGVAGSQADAWDQGYTFSFYQDRGYDADICYTKHVPEHLSVSYDPDEPSALHRWNPYRGDPA